MREEQKWETGDIGELAEYIKEADKFYREAQEPRKFVESLQVEKKNWYDLCFFHGDI